MQVPLDIELIQSVVNLLRRIYKETYSIETTHVLDQLVSSISNNGESENNISEKSDEGLSPSVENNENTTVPTASHQKGEEECKP